MKGDKSGQPVDDMCLEDYTVWKRFYHFLEWSQFCKLFHTSEKFASEVTDHKANPQKIGDFSKACVEHGTHFGIIVVKPCLGLTAGQVKRETSLTAKKLKLDSITVPDPSTGKDEELFLIADESAPFKRAFAFAVMMDGKRTTCL